MKLRGHWLYRFNAWEYRAGGRTHANVQPNQLHDSRYPWTAWSPHLEGPDYCATEKDAKRRILRRLREHCERLAPLMP